MRPLIAACLLTVSVAACGSLPGTLETPFVPAGVFGTYQDVDTGAMNVAAWDFAAAANTRDNPAEAARAIVALEFLPGEIKHNPRWIDLDDAIVVHLERARVEARQVLGIRPDAPAQVVVNTMLALGLDLQSRNQDAAMKVLASPIFTFAPERTLAILSNLPYMQEANLATVRAEAEAEQSVFASHG